MRRDKEKIAAAPFTLSWGAIFGGVFAAAGVWLLLHALGLALGFSQVEPGDPNSLRAIGIGSGIWTVLTSMISLFVGGVIVARSAGLLGRSNAALHGIVLWGITSVGGLVLMLSVLGSLTRGMGNLTMQTAGYSQSALPDVAQSLGVTTEDLLVPMNRQLQNRGMPAITAQQLEAALRDAGATSLRQGRFDRELFVNAIARNTALSAAEVRDVFGAAGQQLSKIGENVADAAERAAVITSRAFWALFSTMLLSLASATLGTISGVTRRQRELSARVAELPLSYPELPRQPGPRIPV